MSRRKSNTEVLVFRDENQNKATLATNGSRFVSQVGAQAKEHKTLFSGISYLESCGYSYDHITTV